MRLLPYKPRQLPSSLLVYRRASFSCRCRFVLSSCRATRFRPVLLFFPPADSPFCLASSMHPFVFDSIAALIPNFRGSILRVKLSYHNSAFLSSRSRLFFSRDKSVHHEICDSSYAYMALMHACRFAKCFYRDSENTADASCMSGFCACMTQTDARHFARF